MDEAVARKLANDDVTGVLALLRHHEQKSPATASQRNRWTHHRPNGAAPANKPIVVVVSLGVQEPTVLQGES